MLWAFFLKRTEEYIYDIENLNGMNCMHDNEVNEIYSCTLLHYILNPSKKK